MKNPLERGFTLIEMLVVLTLMAILMTMAVPVLSTTMRRAKIRTAAAETATLMRRARLEAIKHSCPAIVRTVDAVGREPARLEAFADCTSPMDGAPDADRPIVSTVHLPTGITFKAPPAVLGKSSISGLSENPADSSAARVAIFLGDGSVRDTGGFRLGDEVGNFLEVRVAPKATARIEVRKCLACANASDDTDWYAEGDGGKAWAWK